MPDGYIPSQHWLHIPHFQPDEDWKHAENMRAIDSFARDFPYPIQGSFDSSISIVPGGGVQPALPGITIDTRFPRVNVVAHLTGQAITTDVGSGSVFVSLFILGASGFFEATSQTYQFDAEGATTGRTIALTVSGVGQALRSSGLSRIAIEADLSATTLDFDVSGTFSWLILPSE